jgi:photosystem II protein
MQALKQNTVSRVSFTKPVGHKVTTPVFAKATKVVKREVASEQALKLGFTKTNELFVGRLAMLGVASSLIGEVITGKGAIAQFAGEIGATTTEVQVAVWAIALFNLVAGVLPTSQTFVPEEQEAQKQSPPGALQDAKITLLTPRKFFGVSDSFQQGE